MAAHTLPSRRFYWAELEAPGVHCTGELPPGLVDACAEVLPLDVCTVHAVCVPSTNGRIAVCAIETTQLDEFRGSESLRPQEVPAFLDGRVQAAEFELLIGKFEPASVTRRRVRRHLVGAALLIGGTIMLCAALMRNAMKLEDTTLLARTAASDALSLPSGTLSPEILGAAVTANSQVLDRVEQRGASGRQRRVFADHTLAQVLRALPRDVVARVDAINLQPTTINIKVVVEDVPSAYVAKLGEIEGWILEEPRSTSTSRGTRLVLQWRRREAQ